jgi:hypothetical protein
VCYTFAFDWTSSFLVCWVQSENFWFGTLVKTSAPL